MQLTIRDLVFPIETAKIHGGMWDPYWSSRWDRGLVPQPMLALELQAAPLERDDITWQPKLYNEWLPVTSRDWRAMSRKIVWKDAWDAETNEPNGSMYIFEHADVHEAELIIGERRGLSFAISWRGVCDIFWDEGDYSKRVPFAATATARFEGLNLRGSANDDARSYRERFALHFNPDDFDQGPILDGGGAYEDGMRMTYCVFTPKGP